MEKGRIKQVIAMWVATEDIDINNINEVVRYVWDVVDGIRWYNMWYKMPTATNVNTICRYRAMVKREFDKLLNDITWHDNVLNK